MLATRSQIVRVFAGSCLLGLLLVVSGCDFLTRSRNPEMEASLQNTNQGLPMNLYRLVRPAACMGSFFCASNPKGQACQAYRACEAQKRGRAMAGDAVAAMMRGGRRRRVIVPAPGEASSCDGPNRCRHPELIQDTIKETVRVDPRNPAFPGTWGRCWVITTGKCAKCGDPVQIVKPATAAQITDIGGGVGSSVWLDMIHEGGCWGDHWPSRLRH